MTIQDLEQFSPHHYTYDVRDQLKRHIYGRSDKAFAAGDAARDAIATKEQIETRQATMRAKFIEAIGGLPTSATPLNARTVGTVKCDGFRIEKIIFESRPGTFVTANLYLPDGITEPRGAVLFLCGHHGEAKHVGQYQIVCQYLVRAGLVVLSQDPVGQGERFSYYDQALGKPTVGPCTTEHDHAGFQCLPLGDSLARYFLHDAMRGVDYLRSRPEVDVSKIGVTGNSGGGTQTCLMMVCDPRISAAAPGTFLMNRQTYIYAGGPQDSEQIWPGTTAFGFDHEDFLLMMVPRPVRVLAVQYDFFPIEGTRRSVERTKRFWEICGKRGGLDLVEDASTHCYTPQLAKAAAEFFSQHLLGKKVTSSDEGITAIEPSKLWCTDSGQVRGEIEGARFVFDENRDRLARVEANRQSMPDAERRENAFAWIRERVFANRSDCDLNPRHYQSGQVDDFSVQMCLWWSQEGIFNNAFAFRDTQFEGQELPVTIAVWDDGTSQLQPHWEWISRACSSGRAVMVLDTSGVGALEPNALSAIPIHSIHGTLHKLADDLIWLDDSLTALRTYDVLRALDVINHWPGLALEDIRLYGNGRQGVYAQFAALLDERISHVDIDEDIGSYASWVGARHYESQGMLNVILPGILKHFDLPDLERWLGDRMTVVRK